MSKTYTDLPQTSYPDKFDAFENKSDLTNDMLSLANTYKSYIARSRFAEAKSFLERNSALRAMLINADDINKLQDAMMALQRVQQSVVYSNDRPTPTTYPNQVVGNLWIQNVENDNESGTIIYRLTGITATEYTYVPLTSPYSEITDTAHSALSKAEAAQSAANSAQSSADTAVTNAQTAQSTTDGHINNKSNPHGVTKSQVGLGNVDDTQQMPRGNFSWNGSTLNISL